MRGICQKFGMGFVKCKGGGICGDIGVGYLWGSVGQLFVGETLVWESRQLTPGLLLPKYPSPPSSPLLHYQSIC